MMPRTRLAAVLTLAALAAEAVAQGVTENGAAQETLLDGVTEIGAPGTPGPLCVYGPEAFPVVVGASRDVRAPVIAAGRWQAGRVVALGHSGYVRRATLQSVDTGRLMVNALRWAAGEGVPGDPLIGVAGAHADEFRAWLTGRGFDAVEVSLTSASLRAVDVVALIVGDQGGPEIDALSAFLRGGGGLVAASLGWGWAQVNPHLDLEADHAGNRLLAPVGIQWRPDYLGRTSAAGFAVDGSPPELTHAGVALDALEAYAAGERALTEPEIDQALDSLLGAVRCLPRGDALLAPRLHALLENERHRWPTVEQPVVKADVLGRLAIAAALLEMRHSPPESVRAHPAAADFPGSVPAEAPRLTRSIPVDTTVPRWHSTGLYAAPGDLVTVTVPAEAASAGFRVRIGAHSDTLWHRPEWRRMPEISRRFPVSASTTRVASAFGGLIYVEVPRGAGLGTIDIEIAGGVAAPRFVLGDTDPAVWRDELRNSPAPWAEIAGRNMVVTTDAREVRNLGDPAAVARVWDRVLDLSAELAAWPSPARSSPERFVVDRQISVGYMHSGYPLMAHLDQQANLVDAEHLGTCIPWGLYHEVGHNHQNSDWTFAGTGEVTVNLFTLYIYDLLCGIPPTVEHWRGSADSRDELLALYDFDDPDFELWKREPFLALIMYAQMQEAFGWEAYRAVFATYLALSNDERPKSDDEKRDQWLVRFSRQVRRNLGPFFEAWGVPTSRAARASLADLPVWMPPDFPPSFREDPAERSLLQEVYHGTGGPQWTNRTNWLTERPISTWHGVETNPYGRVIALKLQNNGLSGQIPAALQGLGFLADLRLAGNDLTGPVPRWLGTLTRLRELWLNSNQLSGPMPAELGSLTGLGHLSVDRNRGLTGSVPAAFGNMVALWTLRLNHTALSGPLPATMTNLRSLRHLDTRDTDLCAPAHPTFQSWLETVTTVVGGIVTCVPFTDHPLVPGATPVKAVHFRELRERITALRAREGLPMVQWTDPVLTAGETPVRLAHIAELRRALVAAYAAAGRAAPVWTDAAPVVGTSIRAAHVMELRAAILALE